MSYKTFEFLANYITSAVKTKTILKLDDTDACFKKMAVDILGKFLTSENNNFRFVSLKVLMDASPLLIQVSLMQQQDVISSCLWDKDISIGHRAVVFEKKSFFQKKFRHFI